MKIFKKAFLCFCFLPLSNCAPYAIDFEPQPTIEVMKQAYPFSVGNNEESVFRDVWWKSFNREDLNRLIEQALSDNLNIKAAMARVNQARALKTRTGADRFPQIDLNGNYNKDWEGSDEQRASGDIGGRLSWEIDLFNRIGAAASADEYEAIAREEDVEALKLLLSSDVANTYFGAVAANLRLDLLNEQLKLDRDLLGLLQLRLENGIGTNVDVLQQKARVSESETLIPLAEADHIVFENRLDVLLGKQPDGDIRVLDIETLDFRDTSLPSVGVPADLIFNRPDLRAAKAELIAADADIGAAIAARFPRITLDGAYLFSDGGEFTGPVSLISAMFVQPILDWGKRKAEVTRNEEIYNERLATFTQNVLEAVEEVDNALIRERKQRDFLARLEQRRSILQETVDTAEDRYAQGIDDYLAVISALQELRQVERDLIEEKLSLVNIRIGLFRALGGPVSNLKTDMQIHGDTDDET